MPDALSPRDQGPIASDFIVLDGLGGTDNGSIEDIFVRDFAGYFISLPQPP